ncbi:MAG: hypothetical protein ABSG76_08775 [Xanthobacteraceae bacterium]|jgi:hypothetical protein
MRRLKWVVLAFGCALGPVGQSAAASGLVLGDSIGEGVAQASGLKGLARVSVHIRGPRALEQLSAAPAGSTAFLVLGTNDAEGSIANLDRHIDNILQAAARKSIKLVWIGPACVRKPWDSRARQLDGILSARLAARSVQYVSMRDERLCSGSLHEPDGVHLKMKGYAYMWEKARSAAGFPPTVAAKSNAEKAVVDPAGGHAAGNEPGAPPRHAAPVDAAAPRAIAHAQPN